VAYTQIRRQNTAHRWCATVTTLSAVTPQMALIAAKMLEILAAIVERMK